MTENLGEYDQNISTQWDAFADKYASGSIVIPKKKKEKADLYKKMGVRIAASGVDCR